MFAKFWAYCQEKYNQLPPFSWPWFLRVYGVVSVLDGKWTLGLVSFMFAIVLEQQETIKEIQERLNRLDIVKLVIKSDAKQN